jgi:hypothetical protein
VPGLLPSDRIRVMPIRVEIESPTLRGTQEPLLQDVAVVYADGDEYYVKAPTKATGDALGWIDHCKVCTLGDGDVLVTGERSDLILKLVAKELERLKEGSEIWSGTNPTGRYCAGHICLRGHIQCINGTAFIRGEHCPKCGNVVSASRTTG